MPFCNNNDIKIFYRTYGSGPTKVLLIIGLAGTHDSWGPQIKGLTGCELNDDDCNGGCCVEGIEVCAFDNRGVGRSSVPMKKSEYTTTIMAKDALAVMDYLGWRKAHIFGHSMGAMISCKLAAMVPERVLSLGLLNVTGGGFQCFPRLDRKAISIAIRFLKAKTPEQRADVDLDTHYSKLQVLLNWLYGAGQYLTNAQMSNDTDTAQNTESRSGRSQHEVRMGRGK